MTKEEKEELNQIKSKKTNPAQPTGVAVPLPSIFDTDTPNLSGSGPSDSVLENSDSSKKQMERRLLQPGRNGIGNGTVSGGENLNNISFMNDKSFFQNEDEGENPSKTQTGLKEATSSQGEEEAGEPMDWDTCDQEVIEECSSARRQVESNQGPKRIPQSNR